MEKVGHRLQAKLQNTEAQSSHFLVTVTIFSCSFYQVCVNINIFKEEEALLLTWQKKIKSNSCESNTHFSNSEKLNRV